MTDLSDQETKQLSLAQLLGLELIDEIKNHSFIKERVSKVPYLFCKENKILPIDEDENRVLVALCDPLSIDALDQIRLILKKEIEIVVCSQSILDDAIQRCYQEKEEELFKKESTHTANTSKEGIEGYDLLEQSSDNPVIRILNAILIEAIRQGASDIHFEPLEDNLLIRYRIDGVLQKRRSPPIDYQTQVLTRIKVMASLDIAEHRLPQDGRIKLKMGEREIDFRVSTIPIVNGERIVLRILDKGKIVLGLDSIGMNEKIVDLFRGLIHLPEGIVLVTGPTGSGKTTTLYSALSEIDADQMNIMTIEDPIEYKLQKIAQIGVNPRIDLTFSKGLRHILRQDPDVIMIGEIRDKETAQIAIQSSLTGHLVLTTLHTNDAPSALTRLADMGIEPYLLSSSVVGVLAQRLVRVICPKCKEAYEPSKEELKNLGLDQKELYKGKGCSFCYETGYKGRIGIYELMLVGSKIKKQVVKSPDAEALRTIFLQNKNIDLRQSGAELVSKGITTSSEVFRTTKMTSEEV